jgi:hypothetical protein
MGWSRWTYGRRGFWKSDFRKEYLWYWTKVFIISHYKSWSIYLTNNRSGVLEPGDLKDIELIYSPGNIEDTMSLPNKKPNEKKKNEKHYLNVVLQIMNGKPLVINLQGMTLAPLEGLLAVTKTTYTLPDTPIGLLVPVKFPIEV